MSLDRVFETKASIIKNSLLLTTDKGVTEPLALDDFASFGFVFLSFPVPAFKSCYVCLLFRLHLSFTDFVFLPVPITVFSLYLSLSPFSSLTVFFGVCVCVCTSACFTLYFSFSHFIYIIIHPSSSSSLSQCLPACVSVCMGASLSHCSRQFLFYFCSLLFLGS